MLAIFAFADQYECLKLQQLCRQAYNYYIPKTLRFLVIERAYVHLYLANKKSIVVAYLESYKARELSFAHVDALPPKLSFFASLQIENVVLLCGGLTPTLANPEDPYS
mmetsp:Transcript_35043/g.26149  ORF Transcript_35043/g.26149 Transcript_35043/m.26149 type:complete len:108 (+) Transcript_35043:35-358(+)